MGTQREMRWVCGEEDTWDRGTLPHPVEPPPPVAMQLRERMRQPDRRGAPASKSHEEGWGLPVHSASRCAGMSPLVLLRNNDEIMSAEDGSSLLLTQTALASPLQPILRKISFCGNHLKQILYF